MDLLDEPKIKTDELSLSKLNIKYPQLLDDVLIDKKPEEIAFVFDIDDTLRRRKDGLIPKSAIEAVNTVTAAGYKTYIATGRSDVDSVIKELLASGMHFDGFSCANGQRVISNDGLIFSKTMTLEQINTIADLANKYKLGFVLSTDKGFILSNKDIALKENIELLDKLNTPYSIDDDFSKYLTYNFSLMCNTKEGKADEFMKACEDAGFLTMRSNNYYFDVVLKDTTKMTGIDLLKQANNVNTIISIGDAMNDVEMFKNSDISVCIGNGMDAMKGLADIITEDLDKNGVKIILDLIKNKHEELMKSSDK